MTFRPALRPISLAVLSLFASLSFQAHADDLRDKRDAAINAAVAAGATKASVARAAGVSKQAIAKILRRDSN